MKFVVKGTVTCFVNLYESRVEFNYRAMKGICLRIVNFLFTLIPPDIDNGLVQI